MQEVSTKTVITTIDNQVKAIHFTSPLLHFSVDTLPNDSRETITKAAEEFQEICASSLFVTTLTIFKNVDGSDKIAVEIEKEFQKEKLDASNIEKLFKKLESYINESYMNPTPIFVEF